MPSRKKFVERLFHFLGPVNLPLPQARPQFVHRCVDVDHLVRAVEERVGHRLPDVDARHPADDVVEGLEVLDVDRRPDADAGVEQREHVLVALRVAASRRVGMRQLVDEAQRRVAREYRVEVHLLEHNAAVQAAAARHHLQVADLCSVSARP